MSRTLNSDQLQRVLLFAPHPDDESLATGGLLQQALQAGAVIRIIFLTDGDNNPWPQRFLERRWRIGPEDNARWGARRRAEAMAASARLGLPAEAVRFLHLPDQGITQLLVADGENIVNRIAAEISEFGPTIVVSPALADSHRDHNAFAVILQFAIDRLGPGQRRFAEFHYVIHTYKTRRSLDVEYAVQLSPEQQIRKREAILSHASQMALSRRRFLAFAGKTENFFERQHPQIEDKANVVRRMSVDGEQFRLELASGAGADGVVGGSVLMIVASDVRSGQVAALIVPLPSRNGGVNVYDSATGAIVTQAQFSCEPDKDTVFIPRSALALNGRIFVKVEHQFHFYDQSGWREMPAPPSPAVEVVSGLSLGQPVAPKICCILPCYNVATKCGAVLRNVARFADQVIAVNDGSPDGTQAVLNAIASECAGRIRLVSYPDNRGKGAALLEGFRVALAEISFDVLVTIDSDGQHNPEDIPRLWKACASHRAALVIGERLEFEVMPWRSRLGNSLTRAIFRSLYPFAPQDTQSGLRAMSRDFVAQVVESIKPQRYETELQILLLALQNRLRVSTIKIQTVYFDRNRLSHFRPVSDSFRIYWALLRWHLTGGRGIARIGEKPRSH